MRLSTATSGDGLPDWIGQNSFLQSRRRSLGAAAAVQKRWKKVPIAAEAKLGTVWPPVCSHQITG
jgi:hypothetical protein